MRLLEHVTAVAGDRLGQCEQVLPRVELRLVLEPHRAGDLERQRSLGGEGDVEAGALGGIDLLLQLRDLVLRLGEDVVGLALEVAVDAVLLHELRHPRERGLVRLGVDASARGAEVSSRSP